jgi:uncharacterized membrane protein YdjX (TVP38/TMEM64 family)
MNRKRAVFLLCFLLALVLAAVLLPVEQLLEALQQWTAEQPVEATLGTMLFIAIGFVLMLPSSLLMMLAGFLFGLVKGLAVVWLAGLAASAISFWASRSAARPWIEQRIRRRGTFIAIDRAIRRKGFLVVLLTRIVMLFPFPALNYTLGLTAVRFRDFMAGTNIGMVPVYFLFVYLGTTASDLAALLEGEISLGRDEWVAGALGLITVLLTVAIIIRIGARALRAELARVPDES